MYEVLVNVPFEDKHTGDKYVAGDVIKLTKERVTEVQETDKTFITVLKEVKEPKKQTKKTTK